METMGRIGKGKAVKIWLRRGDDFTLQVTNLEIFPTLAVDIKRLHEEASL